MILIQDDIVARLSVGLLYCICGGRTCGGFSSGGHLFYIPHHLMIGAGLGRQDDHAANNLEESQRVGDKMRLPAVVRLSPPVVSSMTQPLESYSSFSGSCGVIGPVPNDHTRAKNRWANFIENSSVIPVESKDKMQEACRSAGAAPSAGSPQSQRQA